MPKSHIVEPKIFSDITQTDLSLGIHEGHCICSVTDNELIGDFWEDVNTVDGDITLTREGWLEGVGTLCGFQVPYLLVREGGREGGREGERED